MDSETYIGDGVYASFDGYQIWLRAERDGSNHRIALDPDVYHRLVDYASIALVPSPGSLGIPSPSSL